VWENYAEARKWLQESADQDYPNAQYELGLMLVRGKGGDADFMKGMSLLHDASAKDHVQAKEKIAEMKRVLG